MKRFTDSRETPGVGIDGRLEELVVRLPYATFGIDHKLPAGKRPDQPWLWFGGASVFCRFDPDAGSLLIEERRSPARDRGRQSVWLNLPETYTGELRRVEICAGGSVACTGLQVGGDMYVDAWDELALTSVTAAAYFGKSDAGAVRLADIRLAPGEHPGMAFYAPAGEVCVRAAEGWQHLGHTASLNVLRICPVAPPAAGVVAA
jgi:hypothetical protein